MKANYLFPHRFKKIGWIVFIPMTVFGLLQLIYQWEPDILDFNVFAMFDQGLLSNKVYFSSVKNNVLNELIMIILIISMMVVAFSQEKVEDEYIRKIRLDSLVWATYLNYIVLIFAILLVYGFPFLWVLIGNVLTILLFFIVRFNWILNRTRKEGEDEE